MEDLCKFIASLVGCLIGALLICAGLSSGKTDAAQLGL